jgi:hypothetical protein
MKSLYNNFKSTLLRSTAIALVAAAAPALVAQKVPKFGLQLSLAVPTSSITIAPDDDGGLKYDSFLSMGVGLAATYEFAMSDSAAIRAKAEYINLGSKESLYKEVAISKLKYGTSMYSIGADVLYSFDSNDTGLFILGGLSYNITSGSGTWTKDFDIEGSGNALGFNVGAGFRFSPNLSAEVKYLMLNGLSHEIEAKGIPGKDTVDINLSWIGVSLSLRF